MLSENIKKLRIAKEMSQEELATRLNVVRQTISKWEKGLSVPDSEMLIRLSEVFETNVSELLGTRIEETQTNTEIADQLSRINEQLAIKNRRTKKLLKALMWIGMSILVIIVIWVMLGSTVDIQESTRETVSNGFRIPISYG